MITRKSLLVIGIMFVLAVGLSACSMGSPMMADHDIEISMDEAMAGQNAVFAGASSGSVSLTESQASSLITELMKQNGLNKVEIAGISAAMDGDMNTISVNLAESVGGIDSLGVSGSIMSSGGVLSVDVNQAWAGGLGVDSGLLDMISAQINASLAGMPLGLPDGPVGITNDQAMMVSDMMMQMGLNSAEISAVKTHFDDGNIGIMAEMAEAVGGVDSLGLIASISLDGGTANISVSEASAGGMIADSGIVNMITDQINGQLAGIPMIPATIEASGGELMLSLSQ